MASDAGTGGEGGEGGAACGVAALRARFDSVRAAMARDAKRASKLEARLSILTKGHVERAAAASDAVAAAHAAADDSERELAGFKLLAGNEQAAIPVRLTALQAEVDAGLKREVALQHRFAELQKEQRALTAALG